MSKSTEHKVYHERAVEKVYTSSLIKKKTKYCHATLLRLVFWFKAASFFRSTFFAGICKLYTRYQFCSVAMAISVLELMDLFILMIA